MSDNQTNEDWLELPIVANNPKAEGTAIIIYQAGGGKDYLIDITYDDLLLKDRNDDYYAFAWVPHAVATVQQIQQTQCGARCSKTCKRPGCLCDRSLGLCR